MSGIAGIFSRSGDPVQVEMLREMLAVLAHRGPDAGQTWTDHTVGLVQRALFTTPESLLERQPLHEHGCCITADARIDNREELARLLGLDTRELPEYSDSRLILAAYRKWGKECPARLLGDFAFAIWDAPRRELFCARDPFGVKPFYYTFVPGKFLFGSEIKALFCCPDAPRRLNEAWMAVFLLQNGSNNEEKESTFFEGVYRLTPAHSLTVTAAGHSIDCYWQLDPERETRLPGEAEYAEALREQFTAAVRRRLRSVYPVGSTLSGGLDSSSIACTARDLLAAAGQPPLHTFSAVFTDAPGADESEYIQAVIEQGGIQPHLLHPDRASPFVELERVLWHMDEPFYGMNYYMPLSFYKCAHENGVRVVMDGTDGDTTISHGQDYLDLLALRQDWQTFAREAAAVAKNFDHPRYATTGMILNGFAAPRLAEMARRGDLLAFGKGVRELSRLFGVSPRRLVVNAGIKPLLPASLLRAAIRLRGRQAPPAIPEYVAPEFARRLLSNGRLRQNHFNFRPAGQNGRALHYQALRIGMLPYSLEVINHLSAMYSVDVRFPFCDRSLVEFSLSLPPEVKLKNGWSRYIMREAMTGVLPPKVQWRGGKISLAKVYPYMWRRYAQDYVREALEHPPALLEQYINMPVVRQMYRRFLEEKKRDQLDQVWQVVVFSVWMKQAGCLSA